MKDLLKTKCEHCTYDQKVVMELQNRIEYLWDMYCKLRECRVSEIQKRQKWVAHGIDELVDFVYEMSDTHKPPKLFREVNDECKDTLQFSINKNNKELK